MIILVDWFFQANDDISSLGFILIDLLNLAEILEHSEKGFLSLSINAENCLLQI